MKRILIIAALISFLTSCSPTPPPMPTTTVAETLQPTATDTPEPTKTATPAPTEAGPSTANLPEGWAGRVDRIEVMKNMDGTERTVAIEKPSDEDLAAGKTEAKLRVLQWDEGRKEWVPYEPQVGLVGLTEAAWDMDLAGTSMKSDDLTGTELQEISAEPIYGRDGREIPPGLVADFSDVTLFCGDVIESFPVGTEWNVFVIKVPLPDGDIELLQVGQLITGGGMKKAYDQESIDPAQLINPLQFKNNSIENQLESYSQLISNSEIYAYFLNKSSNLPWRIVFGVQKTPTVIMADDVPNIRLHLVDKFVSGVVFNQEGVGINLFNYPLFSTESLKTIR